MIKKNLNKKNSKYLNTRSINKLKNIIRLL